MASQSVSQLTDSVAQSSPNKIRVWCGSIEGSLHLDKLSIGPPGKEGSTKCIYCSTKSKWVTPIEFEGLGGKSKCGKWKQSIKTHSNVSINAHLSPLSAATSRSHSPSPSRSLTQTASPILSQSPIVSPLLAFITCKAYRLRGNTANMKQIISVHFDTSSLIDAHKYLWDHCGDTLKQLDMTYHTRRTTDKRDAFEATLSDILTAFSKLDDDDKLPPIYCEALHLINLPCLEPDPISKRLDTNNEAIKFLAQKVDTFSAPSDSAQKAMEQLVSSLKDELAKFSSSVSSLSESLAKKVIESSASHQPVSKPVSTSSTKLHASMYKSSVDRSSNVILFGVPELPLSDTKSFIDKVTMHMIGRSVSFRDAFRIGRKKSNDELSESLRPRPLLIKLANCWDRRLLLNSRRTLKSFEECRLFIREDLPPHARKRQSNPPANSQVNSNPNVSDGESTGELQP